MFDSKAFDQHENVHFHCDPRTGLRSIVAIHSTTLGPAMGGCRAWYYDDDHAALTDALRLSRGMSYKNAMAGLPLGGGKAIILRSKGQKLDEALFESFGKFVNSLGGRYVTAEDVGVNQLHMSYVARHTSWVSGLPRIGTGDGPGGDPSPKTALGVFRGMHAAVRAKLGKSQLAGLRVAVQGLGNVGSHLCEHLHEAGARLVVADIDPNATARVRDRLGAEVVSVDEILFQDVDVLAPCALGGTLNEKTIPQIRAAVVAGAANNQLLCDADGLRLHDRGILYAPDYVINAGGIIWVGAEFLRQTDARAATRRVEAIEHTLADIFAQAAVQHLPTNVTADQMAREKIAGGGRRLDRAA